MAQTTSWTTVAMELDLTLSLSGFCFIACGSSRNAACILEEIRCPSATLLTIDELTLNLRTALAQTPLKVDATLTPVKTEAAKRGLTTSTLSSVTALEELLYAVHIEMLPRPALSTVP
jgi:hypothetical protein